MQTANLKPQKDDRIPVESAEDVDAEDSEAIMQAAKSELPRAAIPEAFPRTLLLTIKRGDGYLLVYPQAASRVEGSA